MNRVDELTLRYLDGVITGEELAELESLVAVADSDAARRCLALLEQEGVLTGERADLDLADGVLRQVRAALAQRIEARVMAGIDEGPGEGHSEGTASPRPVQGAQGAVLRWLQGRTLRTAAAAVLLLMLIVLGVKTVRVGTLQALPHEICLYGHSQLQPGRPTTFRVYLKRGDFDAPFAGARIDWSLHASDGAEHWRGQTVTDERGISQVEPVAPAALPAGDYIIEAVAQTPFGETTAVQQVRVERRIRLLVTTDKPLYQPGQTIHIRTVALHAADRHPAIREPITIEVLDPKGNKVFKKSLSTSDWGIAAADFELADQVNMGTYRVAALFGEDRSERVVEVKRYTLPRFQVAVETDRGFYAPQDTITGTVRARYVFGKPVEAGEVSIEAIVPGASPRPFAKLRGRTDATGGFAFEISLRDSSDLDGLRRPQRKRSPGEAEVLLAVSVADRTGLRQACEATIPVATEPIRLSVVGESGPLVPGVDNVVFLYTSTPDGRPLATRLWIEPGGHELRTSPLGIAKIMLRPIADGQEITVTAEDESGRRAVLPHRLDVDGSREAFLLRTRRALYHAGETLEIAVISGAPVGRIFIDLVKDGRTVLTRSVAIEGHEGRLELDLPPDLFGTLAIDAYRVDSNGGVVGDRRLVQVLRADSLAVTAVADQDVYRPAGEARVSFAVTGEDGAPIAAALGLCAVDAAVLALAPERTALDGLVSALDERLFRPRPGPAIPLPLDPATAFAASAAERPELDDARSLLLAASGPAAGIAVDLNMGETYRERQRRLLTEKRDYFRKLWVGVALLPAAFFIILTLPVILVGVCRLGRRNVAARSGGDRSDGIERDLVGLIARIDLWWGAAVFLPALLGIVLAILDVGPARIWLLPGLIVTTGATVTVCLARSTARLGKTAAALLDVTPLLKLGVSLLPVACCCGLAGCASILFAAYSRGTAIDREGASLLCVGMWLWALLVAGAFTLAAATAVRRRSLCWRFGIFAGSMGAVGFPSLLVLLGLLLCQLYITGGDLAPMSGVESERWLGDEGMIFENAIHSLSLDRESASSATPKPPALGSPPRVRRYFPETLLWIPELITDDEGHAELCIPLADSITTWQLELSALSREGQLGAASLPLTVFQDFFIDIDLPEDLTQNDRVSVPVALYNFLDREQTIQVGLRDAEWFELCDDPSKTIVLAPRDVASVFFTIEARRPGRQRLEVTATGSLLADAVVRAVRVKPDGRQVQATVNGLLEPGGEGVAHELTIPEAAVPGASDLVLKIYPGVFSQLVEGLENIFRMPSGCFEQTSSTTYPNVLALAYLRALDLEMPAVELKAERFVRAGYQRLLTFEIDGGGFEWFGRAPADAVLTAYGLMEFCDMAGVCDVDPALIARTRRWLMEQQENDGFWGARRSGIVRDAVVGAAGERLLTTAYIAWAVAESLAAEPGFSRGARSSSGTQVIRRGLERALDAIAEGARSVEDSYTLALCANALIAGGRTAEVRDVLEWLAGFQRSGEAGAHWEGTTQGVTYSRGEVLAIETTALAAYAFLKARERLPLAHEALKWLITQKDAHGTWRSTQATVHALRALLLGAELTGAIDRPLQVAVAAQGELIHEIQIEPQTSDVVRLISLRDVIIAGTNRVELRSEGRGTLAYQIVATHYLPWEDLQPETGDERPLSIEVSYDRTRLELDALLTARVDLAYTRTGQAPMTIVELGIPPGFSAVSGTFDALVAEGVIERFSLSGGRAVLYFRSLDGGRPVSFRYQLRPGFPARVQAPPALVYAYYEPEQRATTPPVALEVVR